MLRYICYALPSLLLAAFLRPNNVAAQEQLGMRLERFSGLYGAAVNPAFSANMPHPWEINLFSAEVFAENNYAYFQETSVQRLLRNSDNVIAEHDITPERPAPANAIIQSFYNSDIKAKGNLHTRVSGPGFAMRIAEQHVLGITTALRADFSASKIPSDLYYPRISELKRGETVNLDPFSFQTLAWGEIGLHYSHYDPEQQFGWGVTPKLLLGVAGGFGRSERAFSFTPGGGDTALVGQPVWTYGLSGDILDGGDKIGIDGMGFATDIGAFTVEPDEDGYRWRAGVSLLDVGWVKFKNGAEQHQVQFENIRTIDGANLKADDPRAYTRVLSDVVLGDPNASLQKNSMVIGLPTAISFQADWRAVPNVYVASVLVQRIPIFPNSIKRPSTLAVVPRFENRWFSVSLPVVLNDWRSLRAGVAARLGWLYLGTDNLGAFTNKGDLTGVDAYIGLKINGFSLSFEREGSGLRSDKKKGRKQNRRKIKCYEF